MTEISLFGQKFKSTNIGLGATFIGGVLIVVLVRQALGTLVKVEEIYKGEDKQPESFQAHEKSGSLEEEIELETRLTRARDKGEPQMRLVIDRVGPFRESRLGRQIVYGTLVLADGVRAYGEGLDLQLTLENLSDVDIVVPTVDVIIDDYDAYPIEDYKYSKIETSGTHLEVPMSTVKLIELTDRNLRNTSIPVTKQRYFLLGRGNRESQQTFNISLAARAFGVWKIHMKATFMDSAQSYELQEVSSDVLCIFKR